MITYVSTSFWEHIIAPKVTLVGRRQPKLCQREETRAQIKKLMALYTLELLKLATGHHF